MSERLNRCSSALTCERICRTSQPRLTNTSAISERWQRQGTASAHIIAVLGSAIGHKLFECSLKCVRLHIVGVAAKTGVAPSIVDRILPNLSKTPKCGHMGRGETGLLQAAANLSVLNCGLCRECGIVRTSTRSRISCARKTSVNSPIGLVEWPMVQSVGRRGMEQCGIASRGSPRVEKRINLVALSQGRFGATSFGHSRCARSCRDGRPAVGCLQGDCRSR